MKNFIRFIIVAIIFLIITWLLLEKTSFMSSFFGENFEISELEEDGDSNNDEEKDFSDDDDDDVPLRLVQKNDLIYVNLNAQQQFISGLKTEVVKIQEFREEILAYANVISLEELQKDKSAYELIIADIEIAKINLANTTNVYKNLKELNSRTDNVSSRKLLEAKVLKDLDASKLNRLKISLTNHQNSMTQKWGKELVEIVLFDKSDLYQDLLGFKQSLILLSLKPNQTMPENIKTVFINKNNNRLEAREASLISASNVINSSIQGESFYLHTDSKNLRPGMRLNVWIPKNERYLHGVVVPDSSIIWHLGVPWAYVQEYDEYFIKKALVNPIDTGSGWFVSENFTPGDKVVVEGAQLLLSEEFRNFIPDEDDKP